MKNIKLLFSLILFSASGLQAVEFDLEEYLTTRGLCDKKAYGRFCDLKVACDTTTEKLTVKKDALVCGTLGANNVTIKCARETPLFAMGSCESCLKNTRGTILVQNAMLDESFNVFLNFNPMLLGAGYSVPNIGMEILVSTRQIVPPTVNSLGLWNAFFEIPVCFTATCDCEERPTIVACLESGGPLFLSGNDQIIAALNSATVIKKDVGQPELCAGRFGFTLSVYLTVWATDQSVLANYLVQLLNTDAAINFITQCPGC